MVNIEAVEKIIKYEFKNKSLLVEAMTHKSFGYQHGMPSYERLEFVGDAILDFIVADELYTMYPDMDQGKLTIIRKEIVSKEPICEAVKQFGLDKYVQTNQALSEKKTSDILESIITAVYSDGGLLEAKKVCYLLIKDHLIKLRGKSFVDYKSLLYEKLGQDKIRFEIVSREGPDNSPIFSVSLFVNNELFTTQKGSTIKSAQQSCSRIYLNSLMKE